jgi:Tfp pilus assembly protein PilV
MIGRIRARLSGQEGVTLVEVLVAMGLMVVVVTMYLTSVFNVQKAVTETDVRSRSNDAARFALQAMDREIRSGNIVYDPLTESPTGNEGYILRIQTQANGSTRTPPTQCVRWRVLNQKLERQSYQVVGGVASIIQNWRTIAEGIRNRDVSPAVPAFTRSDDERTISIVLLANSKPTSTASSTIQLQTSVAIRNSTPVTDPCSPTPAW